MWARLFGSAAAEPSLGSGMEAAGSTGDTPAEAAAAEGGAEVAAAAEGGAEVAAPPAAKRGRRGGMVLSITFPDSVREPS
jgi:hypothetical protein